jgi:hypothetical protein
MNRRKGIPNEIERFEDLGRVRNNPGALWLHGLHYSRRVASRLIELVAADGSRGTRRQRRQLNTPRNGGGE